MTLSTFKRAAKEVLDCAYVFSCREQKPKIGASNVKRGQLGFFHGNFYC